MSNTPLRQYPIPNLGDFRGNWATPLQTSWNAIDTDIYRSLSGIDVLASFVSGIDLRGISNGIQSTVSGINTQFIAKDLILASTISGVDVRSALDLKPDRFQNVFSGNTVTFTHNLANFPIVQFINQNLGVINDDNYTVTHTSSNAFNASFATTSSGIAIAIG